jgi:hypothetical protein
MVGGAVVTARDDGNGPEAAVRNEEDSFLVGVIIICLDSELSASLLTIFPGGAKRDVVLPAFVGFDRA